LFSDLSLPNYLWLTLKKQFNVNFPWIVACTSKLDDFRVVFQDQISDPWKLLPGLHAGMKVEARGHPDFWFPENYYPARVTRLWFLESCYSSFMLAWSSSKGHPQLLISWNYYPTKSPDFQFHESCDPIFMLAWRLGQGSPPTSDSQKTITPPSC